ncbi:hypothetical protein GCM10010187_46930 [Actinomadura coerulea]|nr:hypothetical protein GCM10010187_46930 [Actinomadura coerulea]
MQRLRPASPPARFLAALDDLGGVPGGVRFPQESADRLEWRLDRRRQQHLLNPRQARKAPRPAPRRRPAPLTPGAPWASKLDEGVPDQLVHPVDERCYRRLADVQA